MTVPVPSLTNTTWVISGFAINQLDGIGVSKKFSEMELFQPFYVLANLPYSVRVGETLAVEMVVFNYISKEISAEVTLENPNGLDFTFGTPNPNDIQDSEPSRIELFRTKRITIRPNGRTPVSFIITPRTVGDLELKIRAKSSIGEDILREKLRVEGEGETMYENKAYFMDLTNKGETELNVTVDIPEQAVPHTSKVFVAAVSDPVGPAINNIETLIHLPAGCGEQNLVNLLPNIVLLEYLETVGRGSNKFTNRAKSLMELAYQDQLNYLRKDGSFSPFGRNDGFGSIWLTSQTAGVLQGASKYIDMDSTVIRKSLFWLVDHQKPDGSFQEDGAISHRIQANPVSLTAFTVLGFLENKRNLTASLRNSMNKAIDYVALHWQDLVDPYDLSVVTYALHAASHPAKDQAWAVLESLAKTKGDNKWWQRELPEDQAKNPWQSAPNTINIEMTSYALLTLADRGEITSAVPVTNWLFKQQAAHGSFASTSDTYVALRALTQFSIEFSIQERNTDMSIQYAYLGNVRRMEVSSENPTLMQKRNLPEETREVKIRATGNGVAVIQVGYEYNLNVTAAWPSFVLNPQVSKGSNSHHMQVTVCTHFIQKTNATSSFMSVIEVNLPSGYTVNQDALPALRRYKGVKRVDTERDDTKVIIYFNSIQKKEVCPTIEAFRTHSVAHQRPAHIVVYDYYDQTKRARSFYDVVPSTVCDICQGEDCPSGGCSTQSRFPNNYGNYAFNEAFYSQENSVNKFNQNFIFVILFALLALRG